MKKIFYFILLPALLFTANLFAQNRQVSGTVTDDKGPVEGVTVIEKGSTANGTTTNERGRFALTLRGNTNRLLFTSMNYIAQEVAVTNGPLAVTLTVDPKGLGDVVVVGYARQRKLTVTGSVSSINGSTIRENPSASIQNGLAGRLPGFSSQQRSGMPGSDGAAFFIRGQSSFTGANQPLIIVDDVEYSYDQFAALDPNEVENLSILKDAATTAVYGIKGANGVVVVTTRRGKTSAPKISFRTEYATMEPTILPKFLNSYQTALLANKAQVNDNLYFNTTTPIRWSEADLKAFQDGSDPYGHPDVDWYSTLFRKYSHQSRSNMDITGGTQRVKYFVSLGYINQGGILNDFSKDQGIAGNYYNKRFNYRSNLDINVSKNLDFRVDLYGNTSAVNNPFVNTDDSKVNAQKNDPFYEYGSYQSLAPFAYPIKNPDGSWGYSQLQKSNSNYDGNNIVERLSLGGYQRTYNDNMNFTTAATQKLDFITKGLSLKGVISYTSNYNYGRDETRRNFPSYIYTPSNTANPYSLRDVNTSRVQPLTLAYNPRQTRRELTAQVQVNYDRTFNSHHFYGLALLNRNSKWFRVNITGTTTLDPAYSFIPINFQGISSRIGYDYKQKYLLELNLGYNGSDRFQGDKRYGTFPAISAGWNLAEEAFFKNSVPAVNLLKFKGSYGIVGSDDVGGFGYVYLQNFFYQTGGYSSSSPGLDRFPSLRIIQGDFGTSPTPYTNLQEDRLPNNVTWEKVKKANVGIDFALFQSKVSGTFEFFRDDRYDILTTRGTISQLLGVPLPPINIGRVKNQGYDLELTYRGKVGRKFTFLVRGTYSYANNTRINIDEAPPLQPYQASTGRSIGDPLLYKWSGSYYIDASDIAKSPRVTLGGVPAVHPGDLKYEDINGDGQVNELDQAFFGNPNLPRVNYGMQLQLGYSRIRFSVAFQGTGNFSVRGTEESIRAFSSNLTSVHANAWTPELGDKAQYPILSYARTISDPGINSTFWSRSGKYLRLRTADLSYSLPQRFLNKVRVDDIRIYANGNNLLTWTKFWDLYSLDPEKDPNTNADRFGYPPQRVYNIGLNITF